MVLTVSLTGETWHKTIVHISTQALVEAIRNKFTTPIMRLIESCSSSFLRNLSVEGLLPLVSEIICASWRSGLQATYNTPMQSWSDYFNPYQWTVSQVTVFLHFLYESRVSSDDIGSTISVIVNVPGVSKAQGYFLFSQFMKGIFHWRPPQVK